MRRLRLRRWVKVVLTIMLAVLWMVIYSYTGVWGELAQTSDFYLGVDFLAWFYLIVGNIALVSLIWDN